MAVYGYVRVSTGRQAEEGESLETQRRQIEGYALQHALAADRIYVEEGVSGAKPLAERPAGAQLLAALKPGDALIAPKLDRLFRSALDALQVTEQLKARGVKVHLLDLGGDIAGNGLSRLFLTIAAAFAEAERDRIRERIAEVKRDQRRRGRYLGGPAPFGYAVGSDGQLVEEPAEQAALRTLRELAEAGASLRQIAEAVSQASPRPLSHVAVRNILRRANEEAA